MLWWWFSGSGRHQCCSWTLEKLSFLLKWCPIHIHPPLGPCLSKDILDKNSILLLSFWGRGSYNLLLRTYIFRAWQACTGLKETLSPVMHWCSCAIGGGVFPAPYLIPWLPSTNIFCLLGKQFLGFQSPLTSFHFICCFVLLQLSGDWCELSQQRLPYFWFSVA